MTKRNTVDIGDEFHDNDTRNVGPRVVKVVYLVTAPNGTAKARVRTIEHWKEARIGHFSTISIGRLEDKTLFSKVSH